MWSAWAAVAATGVFEQRRELSSRPSTCPREELALISFQLLSLPGLLEVMGVNTGVEF